MKKANRLSFLSAILLMTAVFPMLSSCTEDIDTVSSTFESDSQSEEESSESDETTYRVRFTIAGETADATIYNNSLGLDFLNRLPLTLEFTDYNSTEKIAYLPDGSKDWDLTDAPSSCTPTAGDITMYSPWGNIAIFYQDFRFSSGLVPFGRLDDAALAVFSSQNEDFTAVIEII